MVFAYPTPASAPPAVQIDGRLYGSAFGVQVYPLDTLTD